MSTLYGWLDRPSTFTGMASAFDFLGITRWWHRDRFHGDADRVALTMDYTIIARDFRRSYYRALREHGVDVPPDDQIDNGRVEQQIALFDRDAFTIK